GRRHSWSLVLLFLLILLLILVLLLLFLLILLFFAAADARLVNRWRCRRSLCLANAKIHHRRIVRPRKEIALRRAPPSSAAGCIRYCSPGQAHLPQVAVQGITHAQHLVAAAPRGRVQVAVVSHRDRLQFARRVQQRRPPEPRFARRGHHQNAALSVDHPP